MPATRRQNLRIWIERHHQGVVNQFSTAIRKQQSQIADMLDGRKSFGEKVARDIEKRAKMPKGFLDGAADAVEQVVKEEKATYWNVPNSPEEAELGREWGKLDEPIRSTMKEVIYLAVAAQQRAKRQKGEPKAKRPNDRPGTRPA